MSNAPLSGANLRGAVDLSSLVRSATAPSGAGAAGGGVRQTGDANFSEILDLSSKVPVVVEFIGQGLASSLGGVIEQYAGRIALAVVDSGSNPQLVQAFQVVELPTVAAVIGGRPIQLFSGLPAETEIRAVFDQLLQLAAQQGVTGSLPTEAADSPGPAEEATAEALPPLHQEAYDAISAGDFSAAIAAYDTAIAQNPRDYLAVAGRAQASLLERLHGVTAEAIRAAAAQKPTDLDAQLAVADLDISGGHLDDAFARLLDLFPSSDVTEKNLLRTRLLEYFEIAGAEDARVIGARRRLTTLLY